MTSQAATDFLCNQRSTTPRQVLFNSRLLIIANLFFLYPDSLLLGASAQSVHIIRGFFILALVIHSTNLHLSRRQSLQDGLIFMTLAGVGTVAVSLAVGSTQTRYILSLPLIFVWCATSIPTTPKTIATVNSSVIALYIIGSVASHDTGSLAQFSSIIFLLTASTYASFFLVKTAARHAIEQIELKQQATEKADQLNEANSRLQQTSQQLRALDQTKSSFFANINHDLSTPLRLVMLNLQSAEEKLDPAFLPAVTNHLKDAHFNALRLFSLVRDILDLTTIDMERFRLKISELDISLMLRSIVRDVAALAMRKNIEVLLDPLPASSFGYTVMADSDQLDRVFINLLTNAVEFTPSGGRVMVKIIPLESTINVSVQDSGPGIADDMLPHIFSRSFQGPSASAPSSPHSTGLGISLNLVKSIITAHQGSIDASNIPESGAEFRVVLKRLPSLPVQSLEHRQRSITVQHERRASLPADTFDDHFKQQSRLSRMQQILVDAEHPTQDTAMANSASIVLIGGDADVAKLLGDLLSTYNLDYADTATTGLQMARRSRPDLIITHELMDAENGTSLVADLRADRNLQNVPVILITGSRSLDHQRHASQQGIDAILSHPFDVHVVRSTVSRILARERRYVTALMDRNRESLAFFVQGLAHNVLNALNNISGSLTIGLQQFEDLAESAPKQSSSASTAESQSNYAEGMAAIDRVHQSIIALQRCVDDSQASQPETDLIENLVRRALIAAGAKESVRLDVHKSVAVRAQVRQIEGAIVDLLRAIRGPEEHPNTVRVVVGSSQDGAEVFIELTAQYHELQSKTAVHDTSPSKFAAMTGGDLTLAVVRMVVRNHSGRLDVEHDPPREIRYRIHLPAFKPEIQPSS